MRFTLLADGMPVADFAPQFATWGPGDRIQLMAGGELERRPGFAALQPTVDAVAPFTDSFLGPDVTSLAPELERITFAVKDALGTPLPTQQIRLQVGVVDGVIRYGVDVQFDDALAAVWAERLGLIRSDRDGAAWPAPLDADV